MRSAPRHASYISVSAWNAGTERRSSNDLGRSSGSSLGFCALGSEASLPNSCEPPRWGSAGSMVVVVVVDDCRVVMVKNGHSKAGSFAAPWGGNRDQIGGPPASSGWKSAFCRQRRFARGQW